MIIIGEPSDEELLEGYAQGNPEAFEAFFVRHRGRVYQYALKKLLRPELAAEVSQEVFLKLHSKIHLYKSNSAALPWFFTIVHNTCVDALRRNSGRIELSWEGESAIEGSASSSLHKSGVSSLVISDPQAGQHDEAISKAVSELSMEQRTVVQGRLLEEKSFRTLADESGKSEVALRKIYSRALEKLRTFLLGQAPRKGDE
ncbi:MAG: sigma-70 family RNA polymerase sigma factor [Betaproteobacteria bacterium]|nr:sigma-70 family RNA polymerase sigma factor [Betaproteobacteria bacterium]